MTPKAASIIARTATWKKQGVSPDKVHAALLAQYHTRSLRDAAEQFDTVPPKASAAEMATVIVDSIYR